MSARAALLVLYATQTGSAAEVAARIAREGERLRFAVDERSIDEYEITTLENEKREVIFVVSTTGQGEVTDSMKLPWQFLLRKRHPADMLARLHFTVFGLGDSSYVQFNFAAKKLFRRLEALSASVFYPKGEGDDQHKLGIDGGLDPWLASMFDTLCTRHPLPQGLEVLAANACPSACYSVELLQAAPPAVHASIPTSEQHSQKWPFVSSLLKNERITAPDWEQDVRHLEFNLKGSNIHYQPGDVVCIIPQSPELLVNSLLLRLGLSPTTPIRICNRRDASFSVEGTLGSVVKQYFDVVATPRRYFFELLSYFAAEEREVERLRFFASSEGQEDARDYSFRDRKLPEEVLQDFPSVKPPLQYLFDLLPRIQARSFSISSAAIADPSLLSISMVVVRWQTRWKKQRFGLCSAWLASLPVGAPVPLWVKPGTFRITDESHPIIMIGPGTGCAIFRAYLQSRQARLASLSARAETAFLFGCRHAGKDFLYRNEWEALVTNGALNHLLLAFSRDQSEKRYVQHVMEEQRALVWKLLSQGASIYVSGSSRGMPEQIRLMLRKIIQEYEPPSSIFQLDSLKVNFMFNFPKHSLINV